MRTLGGGDALLPQRRGDPPQAAHAVPPARTAGLYAEELMGVEGFSSDSALLYHRHLPTAIVTAEVVEDQPGRAAPNHPLMPRHFRTRPKLGRRRRSTRVHRPAHAVRQQRRADLVRRRRPRRPRCTATPPATSACTCRPARARSRRSSARSTSAAGDYVVLPTSTTYRVLPDGEARLLRPRGDRPHRAAEALPVAEGQFLEHSPYCERDHARAGRAAARPTATDVPGAGPAPRAG